MLQPRATGTRCVMKCQTYCKSAFEGMTIVSGRFSSQPNMLEPALTWQGICCGKLLSAA